MQSDSALTDDDALRAAVALDRGPRSWRVAAARAGSLREVARAGASERAWRELLSECAGEIHQRTPAPQEFGRRLAEVDVRRERELMLQAGVQLVVRGSAEYPAMLDGTDDPPCALWVRGTLQTNDAWSVAVVGARRATSYGIEQAGRIAAGLASAEVVVVSGAARGIDAEAHRAALRAEGRTIAVVGGGLANPYPPEHVDLLDEIVAAGGAVISECPMLAEATPDRFPSRNRILAAMSLGTLVVEAAARSGAIITANLAAELGRLCMALPGPVTTGRSAGCHALIQGMQAALIESSDDALRLLVEHASTVAGATALAKAGIER